MRARSEAVSPATRRFDNRDGARPRRRGPLGAAVRRGLRRWWPALVALIIVGTAGIWVLLGTSILGVRDVEVTGSTIVGPDQVRAAAAVELGTPLARVDTGAVAGRVRQLPSVADVDVHRSWPSTLVVAVTERVPAAVVRVGSQYLVVDASGVVFNHLAVRPAGIVLLAVAHPGPADASTVAGLQVVAALTPALRRVVKQVVADSPTDIHLDLVDGRVIVWGDASDSVRKAQAATALLGRAQHRIDVSAPDEIAVS